MPLKFDPNIDDADEFLNELLKIYEGLDDAGCLALSARLILILANEIGDRTVLSEALSTAIES